MKNETIKVLIIDDDEDDYILTRELFSLVKSGDYSVDWASSYEEGLRVANLREHHVCLVDNRLGALTGVELIREARQSQLTTPMILLTGSGDYDVDVKAMEAGATDYLIKDETSPARLERTIRYAVQLNIERRRAEEVLRDSETKFRSLTESATYGIIAADSDGQIISWNNGAHCIFGYTETEILGQPLSCLMPEVQGGGHQARFTVTGESDVIGKMVELSGLRKDGNKFPLELSLNTWMTGEERFYCAIIGDVTERKRVEEALRKSDERFELATRATKDAVWDWDLVTNDLWWSRGFQEMFGYDAADVGSTLESWTDRLHPDDLAWVSKGIHEAIDDGEQSWAGEYRFQRADGSYALVGDRGYVVHDESGKPVRMLGSMMDVTESRRVAAALEEAAQRERAMIANALDVICTIDVEEKFISVSPACFKVWGYQPEELIGRPFIEFVTSEDVPKTMIEDDDILTGKQVTDFENRYVHKNGSLVDVMWTSHWSESEELVFAVARDVTARKRIEAELEQAHDAALESVRLKSEFLANMSHEIRTPMNGVIGMTGLLSETDLSFRQREYTDTIKASADALLTIIDDILDFSKIEAGLLRFETIDFELRATVEATVELLAERAQSKGLELASLVYQDVPICLRGDPGRLRQVLTNLMGNSVKFTEHGEVVVSVTKVSETDAGVVLRFEIQDTGIGISPEAQGRLFSAFTQADGSTTRKYGGTGLGLAISKQLVALMGGEIGIDSKLGHGSTFWFTGAFEKQPVSATAIPDTRNQLSGVKILIVDDNATNRRILRHQTNSWGMISNEVASGREALELLQAGVDAGEPYDVAVLDLWMPDLDGFQLAKAIKADPMTAGVALVLLPSFGRRGDGERAVQTGIAAYLPKPVRQSQLQECLIQVMASSATMPPATPLVTRHSLRESEDRSPIKTLSKTRILVAEDNKINQKVALGQLRNLGYKAVAFANGLELLKEYALQPADIILMDCQMPEMDGFAATREIRRLEGASRHTTIIAMTANAFDGDQQKCLAAGMDDYISKPVDPVTLGLKLASWVEAREDTGNLGQPCQTPQRDLEGVIDQAQLTRLRSAQEPGEEDFVTALIDLYLDEVPSTLKHLHGAVMRDDLAGVHEGAHGLKGSSATIGATKMAALSEAMEIENVDEELRRLLASLELEFEMVGTALDAERKGL